MNIEDQVRSQVWYQILEQVEDVLDRNVSDSALVKIPDNKVWIIIGDMFRDQLIDKIREQLDEH